MTAHFLNCEVVEDEAQNVAVAFEAISATRVQVTYIHPVPEYYGEGSIMSREDAKAEYRKLVAMIYTECTPIQCWTVVAPTSDRHAELTAILNRDEARDDARREDEANGDDQMYYDAHNAA